MIKQGHRKQELAEWERSDDNVEEAGGMNRIVLRYLARSFGGAVKKKDDAG